MNRARRGLQKHMEEIKNIGVGSMSGGSYGRQFHSRVMINSQVSFLFERGDEVSRTQRKMSPHTLVRRSAPAIAQASSFAAAYMSLISKRPYQSS